MHIRELSNYLPARAEGYAWTLAFTTTTMGFSLKSLYRSLSRYEGPVLLIIRDSEQQVFGAFSSCSLNPSDSFYGTGETYLFTFKQSTQQSSSPSPPAVTMASSTTQTAANVQTSSSTVVPASTLAGDSGSGRGSNSSNSISKDATDNQNYIKHNKAQFIRYPWTGDNLYFIKGNSDSLAFGAGEGNFGLWLDEDLYHGSTHSCKTFNNEPLTNSEDFVVCTLECWCFLWIVLQLILVNFTLVQDANHIVLVSNTFNFSYILTIQACDPTFVSVFHNQF